MSHKMTNRLHRSVLRHLPPMLFTAVSLPGMIYASLPEGQAVKLYKIDDANIKQATLFYRVEGSQLFIAQPLRASGSQWTAELSAGQVMAPGIEYYVELRYEDGENTTEPAEYPKYNPLRITVDARQAVQLKQVELVDDDVHFKVVGYADAETRVMLGDLDVTHMVTRDNQDWVLKNASQFFADAGHLQLTDTSGNELASERVSLPVAGAVGATQNNELVVRGNTSFNLGGQTDNDDSSDESLVLTANLNMEAEYLNGDFNSHFSGININYDHDAEDEFNLSSGFLLSNSYQQYSLELGDVSVSGAPLVVSGFARRGMLAKSEGDDWKGDVYNVRTSTVEGWESGISFDDRQTYGMNYEQAVGAKGETRIQLSTVSGELQEAETDNVGSANTASQAGDSIGVLVSSQLAGVGIEAQVASSQFDNDTSDSTAKAKDTAYEIKLTKDIFGLASSLGYQHYGANYATIANPNFSGDREAYDVSLGSSWKFLNWNTSLATTRDNVDKDPTNPIVTSDNLGLNLDFLFEHWPGINLGYNVTRQSSTDEPSATQQVDNEGYDVLLGLTDSFGPYNVSLSSSFGQLSDNLDTSNDSETRNHVLSLAYAMDVADVSFNVSQNQNISSITQISKLASLSLGLPFFSDDIRLNSQFSLQQNDASDRSEDNEIFGGSARVSWTLDDIVALKSMGWFNPQFSVSWTSNKTTDHLDSTANQSDSIIMLDFSFGAPYSFEKRWQFGEQIK